MLQKYHCETHLNHNRRVMFPVVIVCLLALLRLLTIQLADTQVIWAINDTVRTIAFAVSLFWLVTVVPYNRLQEKCLSAAAFGYVVADVFICLLWYVFNVRSEYIFMFTHLFGLVFFFLLYLFRSYDIQSDAIDHRYIYCLRKKPSNYQDFMISLCGCFGSDGSYAIYCKGYVYKFRKGVLTKSPYTNKSYRMYHMRRGVISTDTHMQVLDSVIGVKWSFFGSNCLTLLGRFWRRANG